MNLVANPGREPLRGSSFGERVVEVYERLGWSRAEFARALSAADPRLGRLNYKTVLAWEKGAMPHMATVAAIARLSGCTVDELLADSPPAETRPTELALLWDEINCLEEFEAAVRRLLAEERERCAKELGCQSWAHAVNAFAEGGS